MKLQRIGGLMASVLALALLAACGSDSSDGSDGLTARIQTTTEAAGEYCANGGTRIDSGLDSNSNGSLDSSEITSTQFVCNGSSGTSGSSALVNTEAEAVGANCTSGGTKVTAGLDTDGDGLLDASEVTSTAYVCNGSTGATGAAGSSGHSSLIATATEAAGTNCLYGGTKITSGLDSNDDGTLAASEVTATSYVCNGMSLNWVNVTASSTVQMASNTGYIANNTSAEVVFTLPTSPAVADIVRVKGSSAAGWKIAQNSGQSIDLTSLTTWSALSGSNWSEIKSTGSTWETVVATSASGSVVLAAPKDEDNIYVSTDSGETWQTVTISGALVSGVAVSPDGSTLYVRSGTAANGVYVSTDLGVNWTQKTGTSGFSDLAAFNGGLVALVNMGSGTGPYISTDAGTSWTALTIPDLPSSICWDSIAVSREGTDIAVGFNGNSGCQSMPVYISHDQGATWLASPSSTGPMQNRINLVAISPNGKTVVVSSTNGSTPFYITRDGGSTWSNSYSTQSLYATGRQAVISNDGKRMIIPNDGNVYVSNNAGVTWTSVTTADTVYSVAGSSSLSVVYGGTSRNYGGKVFKSVSTESSTSVTTTGTAGSVTGSASDALELQYLGSGLWGLLSGVGSDFVIE